MLFAAAVLNFGVGQLLDALVDLAPPAGPRPDAVGDPRPVDAPFSAQVFKVQAGMDSAHRDRLAFARINSGVFRRGDVLTHEPTGRPSPPSTSTPCSGATARPWRSPTPAT